METIFSKIVKREIPAKIVYENDLVLAFEDIHPQAPHHIVIIPKESVATVNDLNESHVPALGWLFLAARDIAAARGLADEGFRLVVNCGRDGGQTVFHLHMHLLGGRALEWPPG